jgi:hypothetical protein
MSIQTRFTQITKPGDLAGKTIQDVYYSDDGWLGLVFEDDTFLLCRGGRQWESDVLEIDDAPDDSELLALGLITDEEFRAEKRREEAERKAAREAYERREYEKLRAKFEGRQIP